MRASKQIYETLEKFRLSENESAAYIAGLELGPAKASEIAKKAGMSRPFAYQVISSLEEKGLASKTGPHYGSLFTMEPPSRFRDLLKREEQGLKALESKLEEILPSLESLNPSSLAPSRIRFYEGSEGFKNIAQDMLRSKKEILALVPIKNVFELSGEEFVYYWLRERDKVGIKTRSIWSEYDKKLESAEGLTERRYIPRDMQPFSSTLLIYENKVAVFSSPEKLFAFVVESEEFNQTMRSVFEQVWARSNPTLD